jgi:hypothetical protein
VRLASASVEPERLARNEATFRRINEAIDAGRQTRDGFVSFVCECSQLGCNDIVELTLREYEEVRARSRRFFVVRGHEGRAEEVVDSRAHFLIVAKVGAAGEIAERTDPRDPAV